MLELAKKLREYVEKRIREMIATTLVDLRKLQHIHDQDGQRSFLSGKIAAYEEILNLIGE